MEDLILKALRRAHSIQANNPQVETLSQRHAIAEEVEGDINWDAAIGFDLFGGDEANDSANPAGNNTPQGDHGPDEHQDSDDSEDHQFEDEDKDA
jgi:hypothetical protein